MFVVVVYVFVNLVVLFRSTVLYWSLRRILQGGFSIPVVDFRIGCIALLGAVEPSRLSTGCTEWCSAFKSTLRLLSVFYW